MNGWITMLRAEWDRVAGWVLVLAGTIAVVLAFLGVADSPYVSDQLAYIASGGVGGLVLVAVGVGLLVSADLHDEWRKLDRIEAAIRGDALPDAREVVASATHSNGDGVPHHPHTPAWSVKSTSMMQLVSVPRGPWPALAIDWRADQLRAGLGMVGAVVAVAAIVITAGWWRAAETSEFGTAVSGTGWAVAGLLLAVVATATHLVWLRSRLAGRKSELLGDWLLSSMAAIRRRRPADGQAPTVEGGGRVAVLAGGRRYHRLGCQTLAGRDIRSLAVADLDPGLAPCGLCLGD